MTANDDALTVKTSKGTEPELVEYIRCKSLDVLDSYYVARGNIFEPLTVTEL